MRFHYQEDDERLNFIDYAEAHPETWMLHPTVSFPAPTAVQFGHQLLRDAPEIYRDREPSSVDIDARVYECVGLAGASDVFSILRLDTIPAAVDYTIAEYDGLESVRY